MVFRKVASIEEAQGSAFETTHEVLHGNQLCGYVVLTQWGVYLFKPSDCMLSSENLRDISRYLSELNDEAWDPD